MKGDRRNIVIGFAEATALAITMAEFIKSKSKALLSVSSCFTCRFLFLQ